MRKVPVLLHVPGVSCYCAARRSHGIARFLSNVVRRRWPAFHNGSNGETGAPQPTAADVGRYVERTFAIFE